jgi:hypothetical protein
MAAAMKEEMDLYERVTGELSGQAGNVIQWSKEDSDAREALRNKIKHLEAEIASYPEMFDILEPWMVDISGKGECSQERLERSLYDGMKEFVDQFGNLASEVQSFVTAAGFNITDRAGGCGGWDLGVPCTEMDSRRLCTLLHGRFAKAIKLKLFKVSRTWWGWCVPGVRNWDDVREYYRDKL